MSGEHFKFLFQKRPDPNSAILLAGSGRSGTTWLADILTSLSNIQQIHEPLHPTFITQVRDLTGFDASDPYIRCHYLRPETNDPKWEQFWLKVLTGRVRNHWTDQVRTSWFPDRYLIKLIRANLMLGYVYDKYQPYIIYITRHPCAVIYSRLYKVAVPWHADIADILRQEALVEDYLHPWIRQIEQERDELGAHAVWWAVENLVIQRELAVRPHYPASYEALSMEPEKQFTELCKFLGLSFTPELSNQLPKPSRMSTPGTFVASISDRLNEWRIKLDRSDRRRILTWANRVGIFNYNDSVIPLNLTSKFGIKSNE
jgi:hypothetical protein